MNNGCLVLGKGCCVLLLAAAAIYLTACIIVYFLPLGGWATQHVVDKELGESRGREALLPSGYVEQAPDQTVTIRALYRDSASTQVYCVETTVSPSTMRTLIGRSIRKTADGVPIVEITECLVVGDTIWLDQLPPGAEGRFSTSAWHNYSPGSTHQARFEREQASYVVVRQLTFGEQSRAVAFEARSHRYETWASWSTAAEKLYLIPATCFDVLTAPIQIPIYLMGDAVHSGLSLGGGPGDDNPWRGFNRPGRWPSPRLLDPTKRQVLVTAAVYEDLLYRSVTYEAGADEENEIEIYRRYIRQFPDGRNVAKAEERISKIFENRDKEEFDRARNSLSLLTQFVETRPSSKYAPQAKEILETLGNVAVMIRPDAAGKSTDSAGAEKQRSPQRHFAIGASTRAEVEAFMGRGTPVESPAHAGTESFTWQSVYHRGTIIPASLYWPDESRLPIRPLTLTFRSDGVLTAIEGE